MSKRCCYLGIDNGTQGLTVLLIDASTRQTVAVGEGSYGFSNSEAEQQLQYFEQICEDWDRALREAFDQIRPQVDDVKVLAIGISGQMHGQVLLDDAYEPIGPVRLWCDGRNEEEGHELTEAFQCKVPKRMTCARFLWTVRNRLTEARKT